MVATDELDTVRVSELETGQERDGFNAKETTINIVA